MRKRCLCLSLLAALAVAGADDRTMSFNTEVQVLPAPAAVVVDGKTDDWDLSAGVWSYNDPTIVEQYSVWTHLMWDAKGVYFLARYHDLSPMENAASGKDYQQSWRADCYQARVIFDDQAADEHQMHINLYYSSTDQTPYMIIKHGGFRAKPPYDATGPDRPDQLERWGATMNEAGGLFVVAPWEDGKGYNMEAFWPWQYCRTSGEPLKAGDAFVFGIEAMFGNRDGTMLAHRLADGIKDDTVNRIFMFRARTGWGRALLRAEGNLDITEQQKALQKARLKRFFDFETYGSIPLRYELPEQRDVTIAIDDAQGRRVRNLFGQYPREAGTITDYWDCLDDVGNPVAPGKYTATVVHLRPVALKFSNSVYSSATPPWVTETGSKLWGSNHGHPTSVATHGDVTVLLFTGTEGGSGIQRIDDNGIIQWGDGNEFLDGTIDNKYAYGLSRSSWQNRTLLFRFDLKNGMLTPFEDPDRTPSPTLLTETNIPNTCTLASAYDKLWALYPGRSLQRISPSTGVVDETLPVGDLVAVTDRGGKLYGLRADGTVVELDALLQATVLFTVAGVKSPWRLGVDHDGTRFVITDRGLNQALVVDAKGKRLHAVGSAWEGNDRPAGTFVATDLVQPLGADFDHMGRLWITEAAKTCKRVTCWGKDYQLLDQYWGQADYGAMSGFPLTHDASRFVAHGIEFKLDSNPDPWHRKTEEKALAYHPELAHERGLIYQLNGHEYACGAPGFNKMGHLSILKRDKGGVFRLCVRIDLGGRRQIDGRWVDVQGRGWVDRNSNGVEDDGEVTDVDARGIYWSNGWVRPDLTILTANGNVFTPTGFTTEGVPLYDFAKPLKPANWIGITDGQGSCGSPTMDMAGNISNGIVYHTVEGRHGAYPNRYGRHDAPAAQRGVLIAPFRTNGVVEGLPGIGSLTALGGDRGEWFLMSMDGLFISSICQDSKGNVTLDETFIGQESFGGFIWRDTESGKVFVQLGGPSYRLMEVQNLETIVKQTMEVDATAELIAAGAGIAQKRQQQTAPEPERLRIAQVNRLPSEPAPVLQPVSRPLIEGAVDARVTESGDPSRWWRVAMAHNRRELAVMFQVSDPNPWKNSQNQFTHAFIGGDAVDLQLDVPGRGPVRLLAANVGGKDTLVYWQTNAEDNSNPTTYMVGNNVANATVFALVKRLDKAEVKVATGINTYTVLIRVPLEEIGLDKNLGAELKGVAGVIFSDPSGTNRAARLYWHNKQTGLVSDVPSEARLDVKHWGPVDVDK